MDILYLKTDKSVKTIEVFNLNAQKLRNETTIKNNQIDLKSLPSGAYIGKVKLDSGQIETF